MMFHILVGWAQDMDNRVRIKQVLNSNTIRLPHQYILYSSFDITINGQVIEKNQYSINSDVLQWNDGTWQQYNGDTIDIRYRRLLFNPEKKFALIDTSQLKKRDVAIYIGYDLTPEALRRDKAIIDSKALDYNGSFSRGFSVGNAQSLVVNSKFDMQLQGDIGNGIHINAAISDDNIPIQAEGNTQVLQEFDKIFIELSKDNTEVVAGDYVIQKPNSYFVNYLKKLKGLGIRNGYVNKGKLLTTSANIATSRGKFSRQSLAIKEGNQGPYKLSGNNNERYIIILSGTEKIYFNGILLKRGQEYDYVIDYNLAEITFTPNRLIARETRIIAEYEYTDQNYYRTLYTASSEWKTARSTIGFNYYSEQDSKKSTGQIDLDSNAIAVLKSVGDNDEGYSVSSIRTAIEDDVNAIKYELIKNPNFPNDKNEYFLQFSTNPDVPLYTSFFTETGQGKGSYDIDPSKSLNGRVYTFVGENKGNYEPLVKLIPPEQKQMMDVSYARAIGKYSKFYTDLSLSNVDKNRFSEIDDNDNVGMAIYASLDHLSYFSKTKHDSIAFTYNVSFENTGSQFRPLNQYRSAEFVRDWNYVSLNPTNEKIIRSSIGIGKESKQIKLQYNKFIAGDAFDGNHVGMDAQYQYKQFNIIARPSYTLSKDNLLNATFLRPNGIITQSIPSLSNMIIGLELESEYNEKEKKSQLGLDSTSYAFYYAKSFVSIGSNDGDKIKVAYNKRQDQFASPTALVKTLDIAEYELAGKWQKYESSTFSATFKLRDYKVVNQALAKNEKSKLTLLGSVDHGMSILRKAIIANTNYQVNAGQEPKLEFVFQKVENLRGDYVYVGPDTATVKNINDFRYDPSNPLAAYVKFIIPNNEFTTTNNLMLNHSLRIEPERYWSQDTARLNLTKKFLSRLTHNTLIRLSNKTASGNREFNYFNFNTTDSSLVSYTRNIIATTMFNRGRAAYDLSYTYRDNGSKSNQINGFEARGLTENEYRLRINFIRNTDLFLTTIIGHKTFENKLFLNRNFIIDIVKYNAELSYRPNTKFRINAKYALINNEQTINDKESAIKNEYTLTINRRSKSNTALDITFSYIDVQYQGANNSLIQYDILESLQDGKNYLWAVNFTKRLSKYIDLTFSYDGRKTGTSNVVNVGRVQAKATF